jgi:hypothetical protein
MNLDSLSSRVAQRVCAAPATQHCARETAPMRCHRVSTARSLVRDDFDGKNARPTSGSAISVIRRLRYRRLSPELPRSSCPERTPMERSPSKRRCSLLYKCPGKGRSSDSSRRDSRGQGHKLLPATRRELPNLVSGGPVWRIVAHPPCTDLGRTLGTALRAS